MLKKENQSSKKWIKLKTNLWEFLHQFFSWIILENNWTVPNVYFAQGREMTFIYSVIDQNQVSSQHHEFGMCSIAQVHRVSQIFFTLKFNSFLKFNDHNHFFLIYAIIFANFFCCPILTYLHMSLVIWE